jgi:hypothetical protein
MAKKVEGLGNHYQCLSQRRRTQKLPLFCQWQKFMQLSLAPCFLLPLGFPGPPKCSSKIKDRVSQKIGSFQAGAPYSAHLEHSQNAPP